MIHFTADTHFGHEGILKYHPERGDGLEEMHERLIDAWNSVVNPKDEVWVLGDFSMRDNNPIRFFNALKGKKHLVKGNHDAPVVLRLPWTSVHDIKEFRQKPFRAVLCHYPMLTWNGAHHGVWMLHGHSHGLLGPQTTTRMDVGVDTNYDLAPYSLDQIEAIMSFREYEVVDGHEPTHRKEKAS